MRSVLGGIQYYSWLLCAFGSDAARRALLREVADWYGLPQPALVAVPSPGFDFETLQADVADQTAWAMRGLNTLGPDVAPQPGLWTQWKAGDAVHTRRFTMA